MTPMDDGLLSNRITPRRDPSQRILFDIDSSFRWKAVWAHPWSIALALVAPCALVAASLFLLPVSPPVNESMTEEIPPIALPSLVDAGLVIAPFQASVSATPIIVASLRIEHEGARRQVAHAKRATARNRRLMASPNADVAVLSVLVEHIDAQRRRASRGTKAD